MDLRHVARSLALTLLAAPIALAPFTASARAEQGHVSARFMAQAIANSGWYAMEECPPSHVEERSTPGCARIPASVETAVEWLDLIDREVFEQTRRIGEWTAERGMIYATWQLEVTGQRYLLVLTPHPHRSQTLLYVSELPGPEVTASR